MTTVMMNSETVFLEILKNIFHLKLTRRISTATPDMITMKNDEEPPNMEDFNEGGVVKKPSRSFFGTMRHPS